MIEGSEPFETAATLLSVYQNGVRMGFIAFMLNVKLTMPRIATTMLALVSLTSLRNQVLELVPSSGDISWIEADESRDTLTIFITVLLRR